MISKFSLIDKEKEEEKFKIVKFTPLGISSTVGLGLKVSATGGATLTETKPSLGLPNLGLPSGPMSKSEDKPDPTWGNVIKYSLKSGLGQYQSSLVNVLRLIQMGAVKTTDAITNVFDPNWYNPNKDILLKSLTNIVEESEKIASKSAEQAESKNWLKKLVSTGLQSAPQIIGAAIMGIGMPVAGGIAATKPTAEIATRLTQMIPFGIGAAGAHARDIEKEYEVLGKEAPYLAMVAGGLLGGAGEMATELPVFLSVAKLLKTGGKELINEGAKNLLGKYGKLGINFIKDLALQSGQEAEMVPIERAINKAVGLPQDMFKGLIKEMGVNAYGGLAMALVLGGLGGSAVGSAYIANKTMEAVDKVITNKGDIKEAIRKVAEIQGILPTENEPVALKYEAKEEIPKEEVKEPWEMTKKEYLGDTIWIESTKTEHIQAVITALREGKPVPAEVLADYPELKAEVKAPITPELPKAEEPKKVEPAIEEKPKTTIPKGLEPIAEGKAEATIPVTEQPININDIQEKFGRDVELIEGISKRLFGGKLLIDKRFPEEINKNYTHELGHSVYDYTLWDNKIQKEWDNLAKTEYGKLSSTSKEYGKFAITNKPEEDFAETFSHWFSEPTESHKTLSDLPQSYQDFMRKYFGEPRTITIPVTEKPAGVEAPAPVKEITKQEVIPKNIVKKFTQEEREFQIKPTRNIENPVTQDQITQARSIANNKNMIVEGKIRAPYRQLAKLLTEKTSIRSMTFEEADTFINALNIIPTRGERLPPRTPSTIEEVTPEFIDKIPTFKEIGILEKARPSWRVFQKIGLYKEVFQPTFKAGVESIEELSTFRKDVADLRKSVTPSKEVSTKIFNALEHPNLYKDLSVKEKKVVDWAKVFYDDWANRLGLAKEDRLDNYVTHIFEKQIEEDLKNKFPLDPNLVQALDFITPKTIFNPFLQQRIGKTTGLKQDIWSALDAYEGKALKKFYYEPIIQRIRIYVKYLPESSSRYLRDFILRMSGRPLIIDKEVNQNLKEAAEHIKNLPYGKQLATFLTQGNASGMMAYSIAGLYYESYLGLNPAPAIKNASQGFLTIAEAGITAYTKAQTTLGKKRSEMLKDSIVFRSRKAGNLPGIDETFIKQLDSKRRKVTMFLFNIMETKNVGDAYLSGYYEAEGKGLSKEWCIKRGDEVAAKTQFLYGKLSAPQLTQNAIGRVLGVLTTWTENWSELMNDWVQGKPSEVYKEYEKITGKKITPTDWFARRKSLWIYMGIVAMAMWIEKTKKIKALEYTGWNTLRNLANLISGELAGLRIFGAAAKITSGILTGDKALIKTGWNEIRPDRFISIVKKLEDIVNGKKDWLSIFFDLNKEKKAKPEPIVIGKPSISKFTIPQFGKSNTPKFSIPKFGK